MQIGQVPDRSSLTDGCMEQVQWAISSCDDGPAADGWLAGCDAGWFAGCDAGWLVGWLAGWDAGCFVGWDAGCFVG